MKHEKRREKANKWLTSKLFSEFPSEGKLYNSIQELKKLKISSLFCKLSELLLMPNVELKFELVEMSITFFLIGK